MAKKAELTKEQMSLEALADRAYSEANGNAKKAVTIFRSLIRRHGKERDMLRRLHRAGLCTALNTGMS